MGKEEDVLRVFELGADDYIHKPFSLKQVLARVAAVIRRHSSVDVTTEPSGKSIVYEDLVLYDSMKTATLFGNLISLTRMEYETLVLMLQHHGRVYSRAETLQYI